MEPLKLIWTVNGTELSSGVFYFPISFPNQISEPVHFSISSNAHSRGTYDTFRNIYVFLSGTEEMLEELGVAWPAEDCGLQLSLDRGLSWVPLDAYRGVGIPDIGPFDRVDLSLRIKVPPQISSPGLKEVFLDVDCDIE